jgi:hypothetical protein
MRLRTLLWCIAAISAILGCGGGGGGGSSTPPRSITPATQLVYPATVADTTSWRLELDPANTGTPLLLDVLAPTGTSGQGFTVVLSTDPANAVWSKIDQNGDYALQSLITNPKVNIASRSASGGDLRIVFGQTQGTPVSYGTSPVVQVALELASGATVGDVVLTASQGGNLGASATPDQVTVSVGSLLAK